MQSFSACHTFVPTSLVRMPIYFPTSGFCPSPPPGGSWPCPPQDRVVWRGAGGGGQHNPCRQDQGQAKANLRSMSLGFLCT